MVRQISEIAETFGCNMGIAEWIEENPNEYYTSVAKIPDDVKVAILTRFIIYHNIYQQCIIEVLRLKNKWKNKRIKESTLYEKAIDIAIEKHQIRIEQ